MKEWELQLTGGIITGYQYERQAPSCATCVVGIMPLPARGRENIVVSVSTGNYDHNSAQILEIIVGGRCRFVASSQCGRHVLVGGGDNVLFTDSLSSAEAVQGQLLLRICCGIALLV